MSPSPDFLVSLRHVLKSPEQAWPTRDYSGGGEERGQHFTCRPLLESGLGLKQSFLDAQNPKGRDRDRMNHTQCAPAGQGQKTRAERDGLVWGRECFSREEAPNLSSEEVRLVRKAVHSKANGVSGGGTEGSLHSIMKNRGCRSKERPGKGRALAGG